MPQDLVIVDNNTPIEDMLPPIAPPAPVANSVAHIDVQMKMLRILQEMQQNATGCSGRGRRGGRGGRGRGGCEKKFRTPDNANFPRRVIDKYCHTQGECNHNSPDCTRKADRNNDTAMIQNRLGGSNYFCQVLAQA